MKPKNKALRLPPARCAALAALQAVFRDGMDAQAALDGQLRPAALDGQLDPRDKSLATELTYGFLRFKGRIDFILRTFLPRPARLPPQCLLILGLATYERLFLDRVPEYATRSWLANALGRTWGRGLARLATAYMTTLGERLPELHAQDFYRQDGCGTEAFLARYCSLPPWLASLWLRSYGETQAMDFAQAQLLPALLGLRINPGHPLAEMILQRLATTPGLLRSGPWGFACERNLASTILPDLDSLLAQGCISRQSLAAQHVLDELHMDEVAGPIWDVCAGRGGKTCYLLERSAEPVRASDIHRQRLAELRGEIQRLGLRDIPVVLARADRELPWRDKAGCVVVDAPCSGLGVLARRPDIKWKRGPAHIAPLIRLQQNMLRAAASTLRRAGRLLYITCTLNPRENQEQIDWLLSRDSSLRCVHNIPGDRAMAFREFFWATLLEKK